MPLACRASKLATLRYCLFHQPHLRHRHSSDGTLRSKSFLKLIRRCLEAICSKLVHQQLRLSFTEHEWNDRETNLPGNTDIRRFIRSHWDS
jgi:hypothetical protein